MLMHSPIHGTQRLPNDDDETVPDKWLFSHTGPPDMCNYFISITVKDITEKRRLPLTPSPQRTLCTLVKMMTIMDDPLARST